MSIFTRLRNQIICTLINQYFSKYRGSLYFTDLGVSMFMSHANVKSTSGFVYFSSHPCFHPTKKYKKISPFTANENSITTAHTAEGQTAEINVWNKGTGGIRDREDGE